MQINGQTDMVGIIADPIVHVRTPQLFNASVARQGLNAVCVPFHVGSTQLGAFLDGALALNNLRGLVVTIPHKEAVIPFCAQLTDTAGLVGSANVLRRDPERRAWIGANFDGDGFIAGLRGAGHAVSARRVLLLGAGGAGKSIAHALGRECPGQLVIHNRSQARAIDLVQRLRQALPDVDIAVGGADPAGFDLVVNATSLGLRDSDELPLDPDRLDRRTLVCEAVVRDADTALLSTARARGCAVHHGQHMLYGQIVEIARYLGIGLEPQFVARILGPG